jgi:hypothetical protein
MEYADKYKFYEKGTKIIPTLSKHVGKGWYTVQVGKHMAKTRNPGATRGDLLRKYYPGAKPISLFQSLSYHRGKSGVIENYGTKPYTLEFTKRIPLKKYTLVTPVKSTKKANFGKEIRKITTFKWVYVVLDWIPVGNKVKLQIKSKIIYPNDRETVKFKSARYDEKDYKKAIALFKKHVAKAKRGGY